MKSSQNFLKPISSTYFSLLLILLCSSLCAHLSSMTALPSKCFIYLFLLSNLKLLTETWLLNDPLEHVTNVQKQGTCWISLWMSVLSNLLHCIQGYWNASGADTPHSHTQHLHWHLSGRGQPPPAQGDVWASSPSFTSVKHFQSRMNISALRRKRPNLRSGPFLFLAMLGVSYTVESRLISSKFGALGRCRPIEWKVKG